MYGRALTGTSIYGTWTEKEPPVSANQHPDDLLATAMTKTMVMICFRNTMLEEIHAGRVPVTKTGDYSDSQ